MTTAPTEELSSLGAWLAREHALGINANDHTDGEVRIVDGVPDQTDSYIPALLVASRLGLPGWWPTKVVATIEHQPFNHQHLSQGESGHLKSAEAFARKRRATLGYQPEPLAG